MRFLARSRVSLFSLVALVGLILSTQAPAWASYSKHDSSFSSKGKDDASCFDPFKITCHDYTSQPYRPVKMCKKSCCMMLPPCYCPPRSPCMPDHHRKDHCDDDRYCSPPPSCNSGSSYGSSHGSSYCNKVKSYGCVSSKKKHSY